MALVYTTFCRPYRNLTPNPPISIHFFNTSWDMANRLAALTVKKEKIIFKDNLITLSAGAMILC
jgi:hypothetical protein